MRSRFRGPFVAILLAVLLCGSQGIRADGGRGELRGFWADGFNEGYKTPEQIDLLLQRLRQAHCNAVFAQMRKGGDAYYASHYEPWAHDDPNHFDALADLIRKAHAQHPRIAVHAWLNVCAVGGNRYHLPGHISTLHPEWLSLNTRLQSADPEVAKIDPGNPDAADWTFRVFMDVVRHYDVDGIHLDFVRYSGKRRGYNPVNVARFLSRFPARVASSEKPELSPLLAARHTASSPPGAPQNGRGVTPGSLSAGSPSAGSPSAGLPSAGSPSSGSPSSGGSGNAADLVRPGSAPAALPAPDDPDWKQWRRDQVTAWVRKLYVHAVAINPKIVVSAALIAWEDGPHTEGEWKKKSAAMNLVFQDWRSWLQEGILDLGCPMTYFQARRALQKAADWDAWIKAHQYARVAAPSVGCWENTVPETLTLLSLARRADAAGRRPYGVLLYSYAGTNESPPDARGRHRELQLQPEFYTALGQPSPYAHTPPFPSDTPLPPMPWKEHPTRGHLKGFVLTPDLRPIDGALVEVRAANGRVWRQHTDGTGCYAFIDLPAGKGKREEAGKREERREKRKDAKEKESKRRKGKEEAGKRREEKGRASYDVRVIGPDGETARAKATVVAGQVTTVTVNLGKSNIVLLASIADLLSQPAFATIASSVIPHPSSIRRALPSPRIPHPSSLSVSPSSVSPSSVSPSSDSPSSVSPSSDSPSSDSPSSDSPSSVSPSSDSPSSVSPSSDSPSSFILHPSSFRLSDLLVTLGTDTDPGNLYVIDDQSEGLRVRLAAPPLVPFQPGDVVSVVGSPAVVDGEPALDAATVCLTDVAPMAALPAPVAARARELAAGKVRPGMAARVRGTVTESDADGFVLEDGGVPIRVPLAGRKEFGIESTSFEYTPPPAGVLAQVTGVISLAVGGDGKLSVRLLPQSRADVVMVSLSLSGRYRGAVWLPALLVLGVAALIAARIGWNYRKRSHPSPPGPETPPRQP